MTRLEFFAFALNEFNYKVVGFTKHYKQEAAEKAAYRPYRGSAQSDYSSEVIQGKNDFEVWAHESNYKIDWERKLLIHADAEPWMLK